MDEFPKSFDFESAEAKWYAHWEKSGFFKPEVSPASGQPYSIVIPPPNVTGSLHMGHALNATIQDMLTRWMRMRGARALWLPGTDHAGIATQNVVEREIAKDKTDRHAMGREAFIERVWQWKEQSGGRITHQLRRMGTSCDWSRERFTLDEGLSIAVREVFVRLYEDGLIYRANRLINWCPRCKTALSDLEVDHETLEGSLTYIKYPLADGSGHVTVATTRPETMLGDTAVAVNPEDERYKENIGKLLELPLTGRQIPLVADQHVEREFGTGAVKVTPAHDFNDEAIARRQNPPLPSINIINDDGTMSEEAGANYQGLDRYACRKKVVDDLEALGLIESVQKHQHSVGHCYRCKTVIEPLGTPQWYVKIKPLADEAIRAVREGRIRIVPKEWENNYFGWMENIQDWCITRQIWWGHRVPVWYCQVCGETIVARHDPTQCPRCASSVITQDADVLDTWFSSALWPFSTLGWPNNTEDLKAFYPTSVLVTAFDILFFWVARMIMMGLKFMDDVPFKDVYIHAIIRDSQGQKMSKSKGNVIDPLVIADKYGADAFRFTLAAFAAQGRDIRFDEQRVEGYKHFINKLWNATRFILMNLPEGFRAPSWEDVRPRMEAALRNESTPLATRWMLSRLAHAVHSVNHNLGGYHFNDAVGAVYQFTWYEFCDWYIEAAKVNMDDDTRQCLLFGLETVLRLLHPFMPFVTEELWHHLPTDKRASTLMCAEFPEGLATYDAAEAQMAIVMEAVLGIRNIRGEFNVSPALILKTAIKTQREPIDQALKVNARYVERLARAEVLSLGMDTQKPPKSYTSVKDGFEVYVLLEGIDVAGEKDRLGKERKKIEASLEQITRKLGDEGFLARAPQHVVDKERAKDAELRERLVKIAEGIERLASLE